MQYVTVYQDDPMPVRIKTAPGLNVRGRLIEEGSPLIDPGAFALTAIPVDWDQTSVLAGSPEGNPGGGWDAVVERGDWPTPLGADNCSVALVPEGHPVAWT